MAVGRAMLWICKCDVDIACSGASNQAADRSREPCAPPYHAVRCSWTHPAASTCLQAGLLLRRSARARSTQSSCLPIDGLWSRLALSHRALLAIMAYGGLADELSRWGVAARRLLLTRRPLCPGFSVSELKLIRSEEIGERKGDDRRSRNDKCSVGPTFGHCRTRRLHVR